MNISPSRHQAVLVTGCSSGIGRALALHLAARGFLVFATVRKEGDAESLRGLKEPNLVPVCPLDLTRLEDVARTAETVGRELERHGLPGLYALINNAGAGGVAPVELMDLDKFRVELQARVLGATAMVQAFLPLIRAAAGRILWIVTPAAIPTPYVASIHACDFAWNCLARTLDLELKAQKVPNVLVRCGGIQTEAVGRSDRELDESLKRWPADRLVFYEDALRRWMKDMAKFDAKRTPAAKVAGVVFKALTAARPRRRYSIGHMARAAAFLESLPSALGDAILRTRF
jgi:NAD(P)-dependent dehydrogenase (short-subunit alcohol dehydrogenase family)